MSKMLAKMNLISAVQQLPKEDVETVQGYVEMIEKENQELNLELSGYRQAILNNKEMLGLKEQNDKLKKQLEDYIKSNMKFKEELSNKRKEYQDTYKDVRIEIKEYKTQQKEFILYLRHLSNWYSADGVKQGMVNEILQKYKEITGVLNGNN